MTRETLQEAVSRTIGQWLATELNELAERLGGAAAAEAVPVQQRAVADDGAAESSALNARLRAIEDRVGRLSSNRSAAVREAAAANLGVAVR